MTPDNARRLAQDHAVSSATGRSLQKQRKRRRDALRSALRRVRDKPRLVLDGFAERSDTRAPQRARRRLPLSKTGLLMGAAAMSVAATIQPIMADPMDSVAMAQANAKLANMNSEFAVDASTTRVDASKLSPSADLLRAIAEEEGVRYTVYRDVAGYPTVGVGHLVRPADGLAVGDRISHEQAMAFLEQDVTSAAADARDLLGDLPIYQHEFDALVDLIYNVGPGGVSKSKSPRLNAAIDAADYAGIASELDYTSAGGAVYNGLKNRSERRAAIFTAGDYADPREA